jgi:addiction module HigA family antidote
MSKLLVPTRRAPTPPGEMLREEWLKPLGITQLAFADALGMTRPRLAEIISGKRGVTPDSAMRLARVLGTTPMFWLNLQLVVDLYEAQHSPAAKAVAKLKPLELRDHDCAAVHVR